MGHSSCCGSMPGHRHARSNQWEIAPTRIVAAVVRAVTADSDGTIQDCHGIVLRQFPRPAPGNQPADAVAPSGT
jgi:hypothetical protein